MQNQHVVGRCIQFTFAVSVVLDKMDEDELKANIEKHNLLKFEDACILLRPRPAGRGYVFDVATRGQRGDATSRPRPGTRMSMASRTSAAVCSMN